MKRVLSLLLLIPFLTVQAWALRGGPYDSLNGRSMAALAGTYGIVLDGNVLPEGPDAKPVNPETTGVMTMAIPTSGMATGRILIFSQGLMYLGNAQGTVDQRSGKIALVSQVSHYVARTVSNGITKQSGVAIDAILSGKMNLSLSLDYFSGLIEVAGSATYYKFDPLMTQVILDTTTSTATNDTVSSQNKNQNQTAVENNRAQQDATASQGSAATSTAGNAVNQSTNSTTSNTTIGADGATTTNSENAATASNSRSDTTTFNNSGSSDARASDLLKGSNLSAGTSSVSGISQSSANTITTTKYRPELVRQTPNAFAFMSLNATGVRQDTTVSVPAPFIPPTEATSFQIDLPAPSTGGAGGNTAPQPGN
jgi:hypothetical protein